MPGIEFNKGIPADIDKVDYLDVSQRKLIVLDHIMAQSSKDKRIADLLTKGCVVFFDIHCVFNIMSKTTAMPRGDDPKASWVIRHRKSSQKFSTSSILSKRYFIRAKK